MRRQHGSSARLVLGMEGVGRTDRDDIPRMVVWQRDAEDKTDTAKMHMIDVSLLAL